MAASHKPSTGDLTWSTIQLCALTRNWTGNPLVCKLTLNPLSHTSQGHLLLSNAWLKSREFNVLFLASLNQLIFLIVGEMTIGYIKADTTGINNTLRMGVKYKRFSYDDQITKKMISISTIILDFHLFSIVWFNSLWNFWNWCIEKNLNSLSTSCNCINLLSGMNAV